MNPLALLMGTGGKVLAGLALASSLAGGAVYLLHQHDMRVLAEASAAEAVKVQEQQRADSARIVHVLNDQLTAALARSAAYDTIKEAIRRAPPSSACASSAPVRAVLIGLRRPAAGNSGAAAGSAPAASPVRASAGTSGGR